MTKKRLLALMTATALTLGLCACGSSSSSSSSSSSTGTAATEATGTTEAAAVDNSDKKTLVMNQHNSKESLNGQFTQMQVDYINEHSDTMYVDVYYNGELGGIQETLEGAIMGTLDMGGCSFAQLASFYEDMEVWSMPYLVTSADDIVKLCDLDNNTLLQDMIAKCEEEAGITIYGVGYSVDARQLTCNFPVYSPDDLKGAKIRSITNDVYTMCIEGMGGTAVPIDWTETISALTTGTVVGEENPYSTLVSYQMWDCQDYVMETNHIYDMSVYYINTDTWNSLTEEEQQVLKDAAVYQGVEANKVLLENKEEYKKTLQENGMTIITEEDGLDVEAFKESVDKLKYERYPQYQEYFDYINEFLGYN
jgi:TRAP-type C4-dicarboxylate transport system substrate-binding protein